MGGFIPIVEQIVEEEGPVVEEEAVAAGETIATEAEALAQEVEAEGKAIVDKVEQALSPDDVGQVEEQCPLKEAAEKANQAASDAEQIANGHAFEKHASEFGDITQDEFQDLVQDTIENPSDSKALSNGRTAYWNESQQMVVITNPNAADGGTAFMPSAGVTYFNNLK
jgi:pyocin large subunit-like protein